MLHECTSGSVISSSDALNTEIEADLFGVRPLFSCMMFGAVYKISRLVQCLPSIGKY